MKAKKYEQILSEVLIAHCEVHCQMRVDIMKAFKQRVIIEKHKIKPPIITSIDLNEEPNKEMVQKIKDHIEMNKRFFIFL